MAEKWLGPDESVILDGKSFVWFKSDLKLKGTWALIYLTNKRLYLKDRLIRTKLVEFPLEKIDSIDKDEKYLIIYGEGDRRGLQLGSDRIKLKIKLKNIDEMWESMIRSRMR